VGYLNPNTNFWIAKPELYIPIEPPYDISEFSDLTFVPTILRPFSMIFLILLCLLMTTALMFCAIYSIYHDGLWNYNGGMYSGQYIVFGFLPQLLAAVIMVSIQAVVSAVARITPFAMAASESREKRAAAKFIDLYSRSLGLPRFDYFKGGEPVLGFCSLLFWPIFFTIPLQSSLFSVMNYDGTWRWVPVQGVAWTLVAIYLLALIALATTAIFFLSRRTGLKWDPTSLADIISTLPKSNILDEYQDTEVLSNRRELRDRLALRSDRLGFWTTTNFTRAPFYCIAEEGAPTRRYTIQSGRAVQGRDSSETFVEKHISDIEAHSPKPPLTRGTNSSLMAKVYSPAIRFNYIPWALKDTFLILWPVAFIIVYTALLIVSFLPRTTIENGFEPRVLAAPNIGGFSPANFLYSFIPSFIGLLLYSALQSLTTTLSILTPWASLTTSPGASASSSLLASYGYNTQFSSLLPALKNKHYLIFTLTLITPLTLLIPILAGGLFFAFVAQPSNIVLMFPNLAAYYVIIVILGLYLIALVSISATLLTNTQSQRRKRYYLPHGVTCLAEVITFLYASALPQDFAFGNSRSKEDLMRRLQGNGGATEIGGRGLGRGVKYIFGIFKGRDGRSHLGVEKFGRGEGSRDGRRMKNEAGISRSRFSV
jgi:hypothetical protein